MARHRSETLRPLEETILMLALEMSVRGVAQFHGYEVFRRLEEAVSHTTVYRALRGLQEKGLLASHWEPEETALREDRPPRCYYEITTLGERAYRSWGRVETVRRFAPRPA